MAQGLAIRCELTGLEDIVKTLLKLHQGARNRILRGALLKGMRPIVKDAKAKAPVLSDPNSPLQKGLLKKSIGIKDKTFKSGVIVVMVGPRRGMKVVKKNAQGVRVTTVKKFRVPYTTAKGKTVYQDPVHYAHFMEYGTKPHRYKTRSGVHPGSVRKPFLRPAWDAGKAGVISRVRQHCEEQFAKLAAKGKL